MQTIDQVAVNTLRFLSIDEVEKAKSGHPGFPLGTAPLMYTVWDRFMNYNPKDPNWFNRDRFILSPGHGSALYYAMLHLAGYDVSIEQLKNFRQWGSITPGHPEYGVTPGVDASTGRWATALPWALVLPLPKPCWLPNTTNRALKWLTIIPTA